MSSYKVFCETDNQWEYFETLYPKEECPINNSHTVKAGSLVNIGPSKKSYNILRSQFENYIISLGTNGESGFNNATEQEKYLCCQHQIGTFDQRLNFTGLDNLILYNEDFIENYNFDYVHNISYISNNGTSGTNSIVNLNGYQLDINEKIHICNVKEIHSNDGLYSLLINKINNKINCYNTAYKIIDNDYILTYYNTYKKQFETVDNGDNFFKIYYLLNDDLYKNITTYYNTPKSYNFKDGVYKRLHPKYTFDRGFLIKCEYFESLQVTKDSFGFYVYNYAYPVVKVNFVYVFGDDEYVHHRHTKREWVMLDGTYSNDVKHVVKVYDGQQGRIEGIRRRSNIMDQIIVETVGLIVMLDPNINTISEAEEVSLPLLNSAISDVNKFKEGDVQPLISFMITYQLPLGTNGGNWLEYVIPNTGGVTIRNYIISKLQGSILEDDIFGDSSIIDEYGDINETF